MGVEEMGVEEMGVEEMGVEAIGVGCDGNGGCRHARPASGRPVLATAEPPDGPRRHANVEPLGWRTAWHARLHRTNGPLTPNGERLAIHTGLPRRLAP